MAAETPIPSIFDPAEASSIALFIAATSTTSTLPASQTQTSSASQAASTSGRSTASGSVSPSQSSVFPPKAAVPIGGIIGAVVGICSIIALGMLLALLRRRRHQRQQHTVHELPEAATTPYPVFFPDIAAAAAAIHNDAADISDARSISKVRREYLRNELLATQEKITHIQNLERRTASTPEGGRFRRLLSARGADSGLVSELRERNEKLMSQINQLQAQMESPWARGLSDEAPPGYSEEEA
ncbi:hypothetical protein C8F04DRAFT_1257918 [Mycena alexandri]|uniref:Uncharacterized protein n=1 Tax=Mycena alexandri TaxID=1745969 RepID=A0AAD6X642_9AGAR|nr:hypothetical protein C8F04DRAFT_1257918 [Mycena alexandri]